MQVLSPLMSGDKQEALQQMATSIFVAKKCKYDFIQLNVLIFTVKIEGAVSQNGSLIFRSPFVLKLIQLINCCNKRLNLLRSSQKGPWPLYLKGTSCEFAILCFSS